MGLFISKAMVERHGGGLSINSHLGQGTTVTINLPPERLLGGEFAQATVSRENITNTMEQPRKPGCTFMAEKRTEVRFHPACEPHRAV